MLSEHLWWLQPCRDLQPRRPPTLCSTWSGVNSHSSRFPDEMHLPFLIALLTGSWLGPHTVAPETFPWHRPPHSVGVCLTPSAGPPAATSVPLNVMVLINHLVKCLRGTGLLTHPFLSLMTIIQGRRLGP